MEVISQPVAVQCDKQVVYPTKILAIATMSVGQIAHRKHAGNDRKILSLMSHVIETT